MKTKTYILTLSRTFPKGHPREGDWTDFRQAAVNAVTLPYRGDAPWKCHAIRPDYNLWKRRIDEVNAGRAVLSVREWLGAPLRSKQRELFRLDRDSGIGVEMLKPGRGFVLPSICGDTDDPKMYLIGRSLDDRNIRMTAVMDSELAENDGLDLGDWVWWFAVLRYDLTHPMAIIHFTDFRYCK